MRGLTITAVTDVARVAFRLRGLQRSDDFSLSKQAFGAAMKLDQVEMVGPQPAQAPLDALQQ